MLQSILEQFQALWESSDAPPDVFAFLERNPECNEMEMLAILRHDQQCRWQSEAPLRVEEYLARLPNLAANSHCKLELAIGEFQAQMATNSVPNLEAFASRFSEIGEVLQSTLRELLSHSPGEWLPPGTISTQIQDFRGHTSVRRIHRYRLLRILGEGAYGQVWLGFDEELLRQVAIKLPKPSHFPSPDDVEAYLAEARTVAALDHSHIVPVYDVGRCEDNSVYLVTKYIEGCSLHEYAQQTRLDYDEIVRLLIPVAKALHHAHQKRLIHRDIKPANILIEGSTQAPYLTDFGLAIREEDYLREGTIVGSPAYMSPEQARGEGHRLDGRSDIFSLGVVLYELMVGERPFKGKSTYELIVKISDSSPAPPRELRPSLPPELERICLKALSKRALDRYLTAAEFADDLSHWLEGERPVSIDLPIVPRGLRAFGADDSEFFLDLLPGPRNRTGLPASLEFWKIRLEERDPDQTFAVGLIYGPSGCGKSSLVKAGLLPRLSPEILAIYLESTAEDTESRLLSHLRKHFNEAPVQADLLEMVKWIRRMAARKVVILLDQFEQWLNTHQANWNSDLLSVLRQCDGGHLQAVVMVRDDFAMAAARLMKHLETHIVEGHNFGTVDLFDQDHAEKILIKFGQAFQKLPVQSKQFTRAQQQFLKEVVKGLSQDGQVVPVRLALFAEMVKNKPWTPSSLKDIGGMEGIGENFLEETFSSRNANPEHRYHREAAQNVLRSLLPDVGPEIKGGMRSEEELLETSGYKDRPKEFGELLGILDAELRLITPSESESFPGEVGTKAQGPYYQLTHDYLVPSIRDWLARKQKESRRGRAELRLSEQSALWNLKRDRRHLPSLWEFARIQWLTERGRWTAPEAQMMRQARNHHGIRLGLAAVLLLVVGVLGLEIRNTILARQEHFRREKQAEINEAEATRLVEGLLKADTAHVASMIQSLEDYREWADPELRQAFRETAVDSEAKLHAGLALLDSDPSVLSFLRERLLAVNPRQFALIRDRLAEYRHEISDAYWNHAVNPEQASAPRFQAACALASFGPEHEGWKDPELPKFVASQLVEAGPADLVFWRDALRPVKDRLVRPLSDIYHDPTENEQERSFALDTLCDYLSDKPDRLFGLLATASESHFRLLYAKLSNHRDKTLELAKAELAKTPSPNANDAEKEILAHRQANAAVILLRLGASDFVWRHFQDTDDPRVRSYLIHWLPERGVGPRLFWQRLETENNPSIQRALLLCLGEFEPGSLRRGQDVQSLSKLTALYRSHPDPGVHAAAEWLLGRLEQHDQVQAINRGLSMSEAANAPPNGPRWYRNSQGQTYVLLEAKPFWMGSPETEEGRDADEPLHLRALEEHLAFSSKEVTKAQWRRFSSDHPGVWSADEPRLAPYLRTDDSPMTGMTWYEAAWYCNWLSQQEGIDQDQWCYETNRQNEYASGMKPKPQFWTLSGYRLPLESEWEFACRAGTITPRHYGLSEHLQGRYAWYVANGKNQAWPVGSLKPNDFGLFDMHGNASEWCHDTYSDYTPADPSPRSDQSITNDSSRILRGGSFLDQALTIRSADRLMDLPSNRNYTIGLRPVRTWRAGKERTLGSKAAASRNASAKQGDPNRPGSTARFSELVE